MLAPVAWYMYLKRPTYTRPHVSADIFENGVISPRFSKKYASIWNVLKIFFAPKSAETMQEKLRPLPSVRCMMNDIILFENHSAIFGIVFL